MATGLVTTVEALEGRWPEPGPDSTPLMRRCTALRRKPIEELTVEDLRILLGQHIGVTALLPLALEVLLVDPLVSGDFHPGDLLTNVARLPEQCWVGHEDGLARLRATTAQVLDSAEFPADIRELLEIFAG